MKYFFFFLLLPLTAMQSADAQQFRDAVREVSWTVREVNRTAREAAELTQRVKQFLPVSANVEVVNAMTAETADTSEGEVLLKVYKGASRNPQVQVIAPGESAQFELPKSVFSSRAEPSLVVQGYLREEGEEERLIGATVLKVGARKRSFYSGDFYVRELPARQFAQNRVFLVELESLGTPSATGATERGGSTLGCGNWARQWGVCQ